MWPVKTGKGGGAASWLLFIGAQRVECAVLDGAGRRWRAASLRQAGIDAGPDAALQVLLAQSPACAGAPPGRLRVVVADHWLAAAGAPWNPCVSGADGALAYARAQLLTAGFKVDSDATLRLDDAPFGAPRMAFAYPASLLAALSQFAAALGVPLESVLPLSVAAWASARHGVPGQVLMLVDGALLVLARGAAGGHAHLGEVTVRLGDGSAPGQVQRVREFWQRSSLRDPQLALASEVALLDLVGESDLAERCGMPFATLELPASLSDATPGLRLAAHVRTVRASVDAIVAAPRWSASRALALAACMLLCCVLMAQAWQASMTLRGLSALADTTGRAAPHAARPVSWSRDEAARVRAVNQAIGALNLPLVPILRALTPPPDLHIALLSVDTGANTANARASTVKIVAEAANGADMARYVAFIAERRPFVTAYLLGHEIDATTVQRPYRFTMEAQWSE